jgi:TonB family protein
LIGAVPQSGSFEKQALSLVQQMPASNLDDELPKRSFASWFNQMVGPGAGVVWQLTECGDRIDTSDGKGQDLSACTEVNAVLPDGSKVVVAITVGTFKKGLNGNPTFCHAVVEHRDQLYQVQRLRDLSEVLRGQINQPEHPHATVTNSRSNNLPVINTAQMRAISSFKGASSYIPKILPRLELGRQETEPPPPRPSQGLQTQGPQKVSEGILQGRAITRVKPIYPASARKMNASGAVQVEITISEDGRVIEAKAISGHLALRNAAIEAARQWVFEPGVFNGVRVKVESVLTFVFTPREIK